MDKPSHTHLYAGLLIYRVQRNIEFLLLNDSFTNKKYWFCPKGQVIGQEDPIKCALRETFETTGLSPKDLRVEDGFKIEVTYLSGTRPKRVAYYLAQVNDHHGRVMPNAEGVHLQWCTQTAAIEKAVFKSMENVFKCAQTCIERSQQQRQQQQQQQQHSHHYHHHNSNGHNNSHHFSHNNNNNNNNNMSRFSTPSRAKSTRSPREDNSRNGLMRQEERKNTHEASPLYKTRLCERFENEGNCPYGPKCTFAHGLQELRERTQEAEEMLLSKPAPTVVVQQEGHTLFKTKYCERFMRDNHCQYGTKCHFEANAKQALSLEGSEKSWMKILHLSKEEQAQLKQPSTKTSPVLLNKINQEETIISDLKKFFTLQAGAAFPACPDQHAKDIKEVTRLEMRNDLSKPQLLYILLSSLLQEVEKDSPHVVSILKARDPLFKAFVRSTADQAMLLKAWHKCVTLRNHSLLSRSALVFAHWYDQDIVDEDSYVVWYSGLEESEMKKKSAKFIEWLSTAEEED
ncbi:hypothetical protein BDF14DRAFT_1744067 [Spinellus fusiger]|nr:hypothetical protein BDF14DRAFT_1744067 [Spinellus fusiger]